MLSQLQLLLLLSSLENCTVALVFSCTLSCRPVISALVRSCGILFWSLCCIMVLGEHCFISLSVVEITRKTYLTYLRMKYHSYQRFAELHGKILCSLPGTCAPFMETKPPKPKPRWVFFVMSQSHLHTLPVNSVGTHWDFTHFILNKNTFSILCIQMLFTECEYIY